MTHVNKGYRLPIPKNCPQFIYMLILECWEEDVNDRAEFYGIFERLIGAWNICKPSTKYGYAYSYDEAGNRVKTRKQQEEEVVTEEYGDMYDMGGETDKQFQAKKRVVTRASEAELDVPGYDVVPSVSKIPASSVKKSDSEKAIQNPVYESEEEELATYDLGSTSEPPIMIDAKSVAPNDGGYIDDIFTDGDFL